MENISNIVEQLPDLLFKLLVVVFIIGFIVREVKSWLENR